MKRLDLPLVAGFITVVCASAAAQQPRLPADTPQGTVVAAFYQAITAGDVSAVRRCLTADAARDLENPLAMKILRSQLEGATITIAKVDTRKETATVDVAIRYLAQVPTPAPKLSPSDPASVATQTGAKSSYPGLPSDADLSLSNVYPRTPIEQQQERDSNQISLRDTRVTPTPGPLVVSVDHFQLVLAGTDWKIQRVERKAK